MPGLKWQRPVSRSIEHFAFGKRVWTRYAPTARARAAICVQRFDDSLNPAIHITYRVSRRSSSLREPRDPSLKGIDLYLSISNLSMSGGLGFKKQPREVEKIEKSRVRVRAVKYAVVKF